MIELYVMGGMGNQMFQYAYARALEKEFGDEIILNPLLLKLITLVVPKGNLKACLALNHFKLYDNIKIMSNPYRLFSAVECFLEYAYNSLFVNTSADIFDKRSSKGKHLQSAKEAFNYYKHRSSNAKKIKIIGYFISEKYFLDVGDKLRDDFQVITNPSEQNAQLIKELSSCNSVCVHIRRADFLLPQNSNMNVCNENYYKNGMKYIAEHTSNPVFYIFSNTSADLEWIKENYKFEYPVKYVNLNNPDYEELRLMYNCKHFVISNSTFSWWGSYLSRNKNKIVAAPCPWTKDQNIIDIYRDDMIKIPVNLEEKK